MKDVLIAGAGPAGLATALALTAAGSWQVVLVDRPPAARREGETLPGAARALLRDLGVLERFERDGHPPCLGQASRWGSDELLLRDALADPHGAGWRLDRARFEQSLLEAAVDRGCELRSPSTVRAVTRAADGTWRVRLDDAAAPELRCRFVVDATGRSASLARRLGVPQLRFDNLVCDSWIMSDALPTGLDAFSLVEAAADGWFYSARLVGGDRMIAWHSDFDIAAPGRRDNALSGRRDSLGLLVKRFAAAVPAALPARRVAAWSARLAAFSAPGWAAVGDAACCFDPLSSQGVFNALYGGLRLGQALAAHLRGGGGSGSDGDVNQNGDALTHYAAEIESVWRAYRRHHRLYHAAETRWAEHAFWRRRTEPRYSAFSAWASQKSIRVWR